MNGRHRLQLLQLVSSRLLSSSSLHVGLYCVMDNSEQTPGYQVCMLVYMWPSFNNTAAVVMIVMSQAQPTMLLASVQLYSDLFTLTLLGRFNII